jgi:hypothetical protein
MIDIGTFAFSRGFMINERTQILDRKRPYRIAAHSGSAQHWPTPMKIGSAVFWLATVLAGAMLVLDVFDYLYGLSGRFPVLDVTALWFAAAIWLIGFACRRAF